MPEQEDLEQELKKVTEEVDLEQELKMVPE